MADKRGRVSITEKVSIPGYSLYNGEIPEEITMRAMTTVEEKMRLSGTNSGILSHIIKSCIIDPEDFNIDILKYQDIMYLMYRLRSITYGSEYHVNITCPICGKNNEIVINLDDIPVKTAEGLSEPFEIKLPVSGDVLEYKILSSKDHDNIRRESARIKAKMPNYVGDPEYILNYVYKIKKVNGEELPQAKLQQYVEDMNARDTRVFDIDYDKVSSQFGMDVILNNVCDGCGEDYVYALPMNNEFFRPNY